MTWTTASSGTINMPGQAWEEGDRRWEMCSDDVRTDVQGIARTHNAGQRGGIRGEVVWLAGAGVCTVKFPTF